MIVITDSNKVEHYKSIHELHNGRKRIFLNYDEVTPDNFLEVFKEALPIHQSNRADCEYLINVFLGDQDILYRPSPNTSNINNQTVVNHAYPITRQIVGYTFGSPVELIQKNSDKQESVQVLSDAFDYESVFATDICAATYASICGVGYQITLPSNEISADNTPEVPIICDYLDPRYTFVVNSSNVGHQQIMSCLEICDSNNNNRKYIAFTDKYKFILDYSNADEPVLTTKNNVIGLDPITMIENSLFLTGDWELALSVLNALNQVTSDALNDIEGTIKSLLVLIGCELPDDDTTLSKIKDKRLLSIAGGTDSVSGNLDAKFISPQLDSNMVDKLREYLEDARNVIVGIPDRSANSSGGDTGEAVLNRDGWTDIEIVARLKEMFFKKAKKKQLGVAIKILKGLNMLPEDFGVFDVDVTIGRNNTSNLGTKTTAFSTLVATGQLAPIDCLEFSGLTNRVNEVIQRGEEYRQKTREESLEYMKEEASLTGAGNSPDDAENATKGNNEGDK